MADKLYDMMDWGRIEGLVYSDDDNPHDFLGAHVTEDGVLIQTFIPTAKKIEVEVPGIRKHYEMQQEDETGFFAVLLPKKKIPEYKLVITFDDGSKMTTADPYTFAPQITHEDTAKFNAGICYDIYERLGAHPMKVGGIDGVYFAVWAPNAVRVSLVGDFNLWDGRRLPMRRLWDSGIFELFVPGMQVGTLYKYEIKAKGGLTFLKADPYANASELRPNTASVVTDLSDFQWSDEEWLKDRKANVYADRPVWMYEVHLGSWRKPEDGREFYNYRELAPMLAEYVKSMGYTHIELLPVMEHPLDESLGYQTTGYYAPTARYGSPQDFMFFMNYMHEQGIGVVLDWVPAYFPKDEAGLGGFDGTCLYEHADPRKGTHPAWGTLLYNYSRPEVKNFLIANALFWAKKFHADGIRMDAVASMLYLDYGKNAGEWVSNMYGSNENLDAVEFLKHLNSIFAKQSEGAVLIAEESAAWPQVTGKLDEGGLGFDLRWNAQWKEDLLSYMALDPIFRGYHHGELIFSMVYNYSENFLLALGHDTVDGDKGALLTQMPGRREVKYANLRGMLGYMAVHPGKKLLFMGEDFAEKGGWNLKKGLDWDQAVSEEGTNFTNYMKELLNLYHSQKALWELDYDEEGFEWINSISANENMLVFLRRGKVEEEQLLIVCNFSPLVYDDHKIGVPYAGKYKEIFNSDAVTFGGKGNVNPRVKNAKEDECDGRVNSIRIKVPPMGISVFTCKKSPVGESANSKAKAASAKKPSAKKAAAKKAPAKKNLKAELEKKYTEAEQNL